MGRAARIGLKRSIGLAALALVTAVSLQALAGAFAHKAGSETWTEPAGIKADKSVELLTTADYYALETLKVWEYDGRPCVLQIDQGSFNTRTTSSLESVKVCEPKSSETWKRANVGGGQFITAISVCTSQAANAGLAIHGLEVWGASLEPSGKPKPANSVKIEFPRCEKWSKRRSCPWGSVATGVRAYLQDAESGVVGFALRCHKIETK